MLTSNQEKNNEDNMKLCIQKLNRRVTLEDYERYYKDHIKFNVWYQSPEVWSKAKKQKLIDSIFKNYPIGEIYLRPIDEQEYKYGVLDGQQRLHAIDDFIDGEFETKSEYYPELGSIRYSDVKEHYNDNFLLRNWFHFTLCVHEITMDSEKAYREYISRIH